MKRIITLLLALGSFVLVQAQSTKIEEARRANKNEPRTAPEDRRVYDENQNRNSGTRGYGSRGADVESINREYDQKVESIRNNPYLSTEEKNRAIRQLNTDRARRIKQVNNRNESRDRDRNRDRDRDNDDDDDDDDDRYEKKSKKNKVKSNNGKHKGWEKGKGNQRKNRD